MYLTSTVFLVDRRTENHYRVISGTAWLSGGNGFKVLDRKLIDRSEGFHIVQPNFSRYVPPLTIVSNSRFLSVSILRNIDKLDKKRDLMDQESINQSINCKAGPSSRMFYFSLTEGILVERHNCFSIFRSIWYESTANCSAAIFVYNHFYLCQSLCCPLHSKLF